MKQFGIDISQFQGRFNMERAKSEGIKFCIIKCGGADDGLYADPEYEHNYAEAKRLGIPVGVYFLARGESEAAVRKEADYCYDHFLKGKQLELPVWYDAENRKQMKVGRKNMSRLVLAFCDQIRKHGYMAGVYSSGSYFERFMDDSMLKDVPHWVAQYYTHFEYDNLNSVGIWQYGGSTNYIRSNQVGGVTCDQDYLFVDYEKQIKADGLNGWGNPVAPVKPVKPELKPIDEVAQEVWDGLWGNGDERKQRLTAAGYDYDKVQERVTEMAPKPKPQKVHVVVAGDTVWDLAQKYGTTVQAIADLNGMKNPALIHVGDKIKLP